jgi:ketosteroid isomerase-like protein
MNRIRLVSWVALIALAGAACERTETPEAFPQAAADGWVAAFNSGDAAGLALMYSEDSLLLPYDRPTVSGTAAIEEFWLEYQPGQVRIEVSGVSAERVGPYWFREGSYTAIYPDEGEPRVGKFMELWKQAGSAWLLYRQMWSPNAPTPPGMPATIAPGAEGAA